MIARWLMLALLGASSQAPPPVDAEVVRAALARDPARLPRAPAGRWREWSPRDALPAAIEFDFAVATLAYRKADFPRALERYLVVLEHEPDLPAALYQGGLCYFRLRRYGDCATLVERFAEAAPKEIGATQVLGHCYYSLGDYGKARTHYESVLAASPTSGEALRGLALSWMRLGDAEKALELLGKVLELKPDHADAQAWIAQIHYDQGDSERALEAARRAKALDPFEPRPWYLESRALLELGREKEAAEARERFDVLSSVEQQVRQLEGRLAHDPTSVASLRRLVELHARIGNDAASRAALARWIEQAPTDVSARIVALDVAEAAGTREDASRAASELEKVAGGDVAAWDRLERYFASIRDRVRQISAGERAMRLRGNQR